MRVVLLVTLVIASSGWTTLRKYTTPSMPRVYFNLDPSADIMQDQYVTEYSFEEPQPQHFSFIQAILRYLGKHNDTDQED